MEIGNDSGNIGRKKAIIFFIVLLAIISTLAVYAGTLINRKTENKAVVSAPLVVLVSPEADAPQKEEMASDKTIDAKCHVIDGLPDLSCTPGAIDPRVTQENIKETICKSGYTKSVRPPVAVTSKIKEQSMKDYGFTDSPNNYELDHIISLELGGSPEDVKNLFPEPYNIDLGATKKDKVENYLHAQVCSGMITLKEAQRQISENWVLVYQEKFFAH